jgi:hypothetical protein
MKVHFQMHPLSISLVFALVLSCSSRSAAQSLPDFSTAKKWDTDIRIDGWNDNLRPYLPVLNACEFGEYDTHWYLVKDSTIWYWGKIPMLCLTAAKYPNAPLSDDDRKLYSTAVGSNGYGRWYAVLTGPDCGYVYTYDVSLGGRFTWQLEKLTCK